MKPTIQTVKQATASHYGLSVHDLEGPWRTRNIVHPRQVAVYLSRRCTLRSLPEIGHHFGGRDHTTMIHSIKSVERRLMDDPLLARDIEEIVSVIDGNEQVDVNKRLERLAELFAPMVLNLMAQEERSAPKARSSSSNPSQTVSGNLPIVMKDQPPAITNHHPAIQKVIRAITRWETDKFSRGDRHALEGLEQACLELKKAFAPPPKFTPRKRKLS